MRASDGWFGQSSLIANLRVAMICGMTDGCPIEERRFNGGHPRRQ